MWMRRRYQIQNRGRLGQVAFSMQTGIGRSSPKRLRPAIFWSIISKTALLWDIHPSQNFDPDWYLHTYPDVAETGINPLLHYVRWRRAQGRAADEAQP